MILSGITIESLNFQRLSHVIASSFSQTPVDLVTDLNHCSECPLWLVGIITY